MLALLLFRHNQKQGLQSKILPAMIATVPIMWYGLAWMCMLGLEAFALGFNQRACDRQQLKAHKTEQDNGNFILQVHG